MMKKLSILLALALLLGVLAACSGNDSENTEGSNDNSGGQNGEAKAPEDFEGELEIWTFFGDVEKMGAQFEEKYPNVSVNVSVFPGDQYQTKLMNAINSRTDIPDIFDLERGYMGKFINQDFVADLSAMGADELVEDYVPYVKELGVGEDGSVRAISDHSSPGAFWYHRDLAEEYLGTSDPDEVSAMVSTWDDIIELGKQVAADSNGDVQLISHFGDVFNTEKANQELWVQDDTLVIDPEWETVFNNMKQIREEGVDAKLGYFSAGWGDALNEGGVIMFANPAWAGFMVGNDDGQANGKYGLAQTPSGYYDGGTYRAVYEGSENKDLAYEFIKFIASEEWQQYNLEETGNMPALTTIYDENGDSFTHEFFGDQKILDTYKEQVMEIPAVKATENNEEISALWYDAAAEAVDNGQDYDTVLSKFKDSVKNGYPNVDVE
ncbi:ABC transporter substrate-binding protein [Gracilibacillus alcaliphilus]|uniref:ABC transporter substrate-binding protein n=1 Tax=Gracilibacillus alcaliphilus TaxID=1401441 RepID=UPI00195E37AA|nr:extracellular solute-binding protein [Gracilibacillus alcaliphilus]MBM7677568.1 multiple sugar transport system substrate-binding protein [Gracilibacillus alcaliphilus]